jgi:hypothetical protein
MSEDTEWALVSWEEARATALPQVMGAMDAFLPPVQMGLLVEALATVIAAATVHSPELRRECVASIARKLPLAVEERVNLLVATMRPKGTA